MSGSFEVGGGRGKSEKVARNAEKQSEGKEILSRFPGNGREPGKPTKRDV